jgi:hypothetical protein
VPIQPFQPLQIHPDPSAYLHRRDDPYRLPLRDLPREYGAPTTVWRRLYRWGEAGVWERIWRTALAALEMQGKLDWSMAFLDGSCAPAKKGGEKVGLTRKGKGTKWMVVVDGNGLPLGFHLDGANRAEVRLAEQTLNTLRSGAPGIREPARSGTKLGLACSVAYSMMLGQPMPIAYCLCLLPMPGSWAR